MPHPGPRRPKQHGLRIVSQITQKSQLPLPPTPLTREKSREESGTRRPGTPESLSWRLETIRHGTLRNQHSGISFILSVKDLQTKIF